VSVVVKGVEVPKDCDSCWLPERICNLWLATDLNKRHSGCPIRPLPEKHGRLIDGDALMERSSWYNLCGHNRSIHGVQDYEIASMETIVEAEGD